MMLVDSVRPAPQRDIPGLRTGFRDRVDATGWCNGSMRICQVTAFVQARLSDALPPGKRCVKTLRLKIL